MEQPPVCPPCNAGKHSECLGDPEAQPCFCGANHEPFRVIVPFTKRIPEVERAVKIAGEVASVEPEWVDVSGDDEAYHRLLHDLWNCGQTFIINEHDNIPHPWSYREMGECNHAWCGTPYMVVGKIQTALGLTKFHRVLTRERPNALDMGDRYWAHQDIVLGLALLGTNIGQHVHMPPINHLNPRASLGRRRNKTDVNVTEVIAEALAQEDRSFRAFKGKAEINRAAKRVFDRLRQDSVAILSLVREAGMELEQITGARFYPADELPSPTEEVKVRVKAPLDLGDTEFIWMGDNPAWQLGDEDLRPEEREQQT